MAHILILGHYRKDTRRPAGRRGSPISPLRSCLRRLRTALIRHLFNMGGKLGIPCEHVVEGVFVELPDSLHGTTTVEGSRFRLSRTPACVECAGPTLGRDNQYVLETILGYSPERIATLTAAGILR